MSGECDICGRAGCVEANHARLKRQTKTRQLRECRRLLRQIILMYEYARECNDDWKGLRMVPISERFIEAAQAAGGGNE